MRAKRFRLNSNSVWSGEHWVDDVSGVTDTRRLEQKDLSLVVRDRAVLDTCRNDDDFTRLEIVRALLCFKPKLALPGDEHLIDIMHMPWELALDLHDLELLTVELADDFRTPVLG